jgi:protein O-mannosyl-transferase
MVAKNSRRRRAPELQFAAHTVASCVHLPGWILPAAIVAISAAAFLPVLSNQFVNIDDRANLLANPYYRGLAWAQLRWMFTTVHNSLYRPITWITFGVDYLLWGPEPCGYHLTSLLFHCVNAVLLFYLTKGLLSLVTADLNARNDFSLPGSAALAAVLFSVHPLRVEVVAWASARSDVVAGLFVIVTVLCYLRAVRDQRRYWLRLALLAYALSLLAKPTGITLAFVLLILDIYPLRRFGGGAEKWFAAAARPIWYEKVPFLLLGIGAGVIALIAKKQSNLLMDFDHYGVADRIAQALYGATFYLWKTFIPVGLSPLYELPPHSDAHWTWVFLSGTVFGAVTIGFITLHRHWPAGLASWLAYLILLFPVSGIVQNGPQIAADRYSYLSCIPWAILAGGVLGQIYQWQQSSGFRWPVFKCSAVLAGPIVLTLLGLTWRQSQVWRNAETLWRHALTVDENSFFANQFLGTALFDQRRTEEALQHFRRALAINPNRSSAHNNMGLILVAQGNYLQATKHYEHALVLDPGSTIAHYNIGRILATEGNQTEAIVHYRAALQFSPNHIETLNDLGLLLAMRGQVDDAFQYFHRASQSNPNYARTFFNIGQLLVEQGKWAEAIRNYEHAVKLSPEEAQIHVALGDLYSRAAEPEKGISHFEEALKIQPNLVDVHVAVGRLLAKQGKKEEAAKHYQFAVDLMKAAKAR